MWFRAPDPTATPSLRRRLLWLVLAAIAIASAIQGASAYRMALRNADALFDGQLQQLAQSVDAGAPLLARDAAVVELSVQVWGPGGILLFGSRGIELPMPGVIGFSDVTVDGGEYRVYRLDTGEHIIQVAQDLDARRARARSLALQAVLPVLVLAPLLMAAVGWLITYSLAPVERMRRQVAGRHAEDLSPLPEAGVPAEVLPLVRELNLLFHRVDEAFASQRHFVADAAHELRSPLTALKLQAQALRAHGQDIDREAAVRRLEEGIDRAIALLSQLLLLARMDRDDAGNREPIALESLCREAVADVLVEARRKNIDVGLKAVDATASVLGQPERLRILLRNLLDNAVKFSPAGGRVDLSILSDGGCPVLAGGGQRARHPGRGTAPGVRPLLPGGGRRRAGQRPGPRDRAGHREATRAEVRLGRSRDLGGLQVDVRFPAGLSEA
jgi:two-component system OmpR family sensor kinase